MVLGSDVSVLWVDLCQPLVLWKTDSILRWIILEYSVIASILPQIFIVQIIYFSFWEFTDKRHCHESLRNNLVYMIMILEEWVLSDDIFFYSWWRHEMETFSVLLALCARNWLVTGEFPAQRPVTRSFDAFFDLRLNKRLSKQLCGWWFETPSCSLWCHCNVISIVTADGSGLQLQGISSNNDEKILATLPGFSDQNSIMHLSMIYCIYYLLIWHAALFDMWHIKQWEGFL